MANLKEIRKRIRSIKNTAKVTRAMQMVSATKSRITQQSAVNVVEYEKQISAMAAALGLTSDIDSPYLIRKEQIKNIAIIIVGPSRGFVGILTSSLVQSINKIIKELQQKHPQAAIHGISVHKLGLRILQYANIKPDYHFADYVDRPKTTDLFPLIDLVQSQFLAGNYDLVYMIFPKFVNLLTYKPEIKQILPIDPKSIINEDQPRSVDDTFIFDPDKNSVIDSLLEKFFETQIIHAVLNSNASEHAARMMTMKNATDNANNLGTQLSLEYNQLRQSKITQQIIEISSGGSRL